MDQAIFPFLDLPKELRLMVYENVPITIRHHKLPILSSSITVVRKTLPLTVLRTCRLVYDEAYPMLRPKPHQLLSIPPRMVIGSPSLLYLASYTRKSGGLDDVLHLLSYAMHASSSHVAPQDDRIAAPLDEKALMNECASQGGGLLRNLRPSELAVLIRFLQHASLCITKTDAQLGRYQPVVPSSKPDYKEIELQLLVNRLECHHSSCHMLLAARPWEVAVRNLMDEVFSAGCASGPQLELLILDPCGEDTPREHRILTKPMLQQGLIDAFEG